MEESWNDLFAKPNWCSRRRRQLLGRSGGRTHPRHSARLVSAPPPRHPRPTRSCFAQPSRPPLGRNRRRHLHRRPDSRPRRPNPQPERSRMTEKQKLLILSQPQRATLEGLSNRRPQLPTDPIRDELVTLGLVVKQGAKWALTPQGKQVLAASTNRRNAGGFSV